MLRNYLKTFLRKSRKDLTYTFINTFGLAIGIASFLFIVQYVRFESDIDSFHEDSDRIFMLTADMKWNSMEDQFPATPPALGTSIATNFDEVAYVTRMYPYSELFVSIDDQSFKEEHIIAVDSNFLNVFTFELLEGDVESVFRDKYSVVLPTSYAQKYFGDQDPMNRLLKIGENEFKVTGIIEDAPRNSHIEYGPLVSILSSGGVEYFEWSWIWHNLATYIKLTPQGTQESVQAKIPQLIMDNASYALERITGKTVEQFFEEGNRLGYFLQPLRDVYYDRNMVGPTGNKQYLTIFLAVAILILALACINYMNLSTARSMKRAKEVGLRKVMGTSRNQLIIQFVLEAIVYSIIATVLAILLGEVFGSYLTRAFGIRWDLSFISSPVSIVFVMAATLLVALVSGLYPALYLSAFQPSKVLYGMHQKGHGKSFFRNLLVVFQFIISFGTIIFAFTAHEQIAFMRNKDHGFNRDQILIIKNLQHITDRNAYKTEVKRLSEVNNASLSSAIPTNGLIGEIFKKVENPEQDFVFDLMEADADFIETLNIEIKEGRSFTESDLRKSEPGILINEAAKRALEFGSSTLGSQLAAMDGYRSMDIVGVTSDFDFTLGGWENGPLVIRPSFKNEPNRSVRYLIINLTTEDLQTSLTKIEEIWKEQNAGIPFEYEFVDEIFADFFSAETRLSLLLSVFSGTAITIALMGLVGLISYHTEQLTQSIGVRKVLGASIPGIILLITRDYAKLLLIAIIVAVPIVNYFITGWLDDFVYGMPLGVIYFLVPGLSIIMVSLAIIWMHALRAARANPIEALRNE